MVYGMLYIYNGVSVDGTIWLLPIWTGISGFSTAFIIQLYLFRLS
jgi:hypothetical protein